MNKNHMIIAAAGTTVAALSSTFAWMGYMNYLQELFPETDRKVLSKTLRHFFMKAFRNKYGDISNYNEDQMKALFALELKLASK